MSAFWYLVWHSGRNRFLSVFRRAKNPRYMAALVVGALYLWTFLHRPLGGQSTMSMLLGTTTEMLVTLLIFFTLMGSWVFGSDTTALAFTQAELSMLFPAPLSRRALIGYKLFRAQFVVLVNTLIWVFVLRRGNMYLPTPLRTLSLWMLFSTMNLHRLGAAVVRSSWQQHGGAGVRKHWMSTAIFGAITVVVATGLIVHRGELLAASDPGAFLAALGNVLARPPASWGLLPVHLIVGPTFARSAYTWGQVIWPAAIVLGVHLWWVTQTNQAFEDAAIVASAARARKTQARRTRLAGGGVAPARPVSSTLRLAAAGHPALAIFWKNMLCLRRTSQLRVFIGPAVTAVFIGIAIAKHGNGTGDIVAGCAAVLCAMLLLFGGRLIRNDLRHDMQHLPLLKTLPLAANEIVLAEVASSAVPMAALQILLITVAYVATLASDMVPVAPNVRLALWIASPAVLLAINAALLTMQNALAVLFPAWVRLGPMVNTGVEALGQNVLATTASLLALVIALLPPAAIAWAVVFRLHESGAIAIGAVTIAGACLLAAETYGVIRFLGRALARAEPAAVSG